MIKAKDIRVGMEFTTNANALSARVFKDGVRQVKYGVSEGKTYKIVSVKRNPYAPPDGIMPSAQLFFFDDNNSGNNVIFLEGGDLIKVDQSNYASHILKESEF